MKIEITKTKLIILAGVVIILVAAGVLLGLNWNSWFGNEIEVSATPTPGTGAPDIDPNAGQWTGDNSEDRDEGRTEEIKIPGYPSITVDADTRNVTMALLNPEGNPCYFTFELVLKDTGESIYKSKMVPPGKYISEVTLSNALAEGEYKAIIRITTASLEDQSPMNGANVETVLIARKGKL